MSATSPARRFVARALAAHAALALGIAALVYLLAVTGVIAVFNHELQRWEQPGAPEIDVLSPAAAARAAHDMLAQETAPTAHLFVQLPTRDLPRAVVTTDNGARFVTADGALAGPEHHPWTQFLLDLHFYLHLPAATGLTVVGAIGVLLVSLALTGLLGHPKIFRDAFTLRLGRHARLTRIDWHNRLGVWTLPFLLSSALTGAMLGLATVAAYGIAALDFGGDVEAAFGQVFGAEPVPDARPAALPDITRALYAMQQTFPAREPTYVIVHEPQTRGQLLQVLADHDERLIFGEYYQFDADGRFTGTVGMADGTIGQQVVASTYKLHFGTFGGLPVKFAYAGLGLLLAVITCTGMHIFFLRRRERGHALPGLEGAWHALVWGLPGALAAAQLTSLLGTSAQANLAPLFWSLLAAAVVVGFWSGNRPGVFSWGRGEVVRMFSAGLITAAALAHYAAHADRYDSPAAYAVLLAQLLVAACLALPAWASKQAGQRRHPAVDDVPRATPRGS